MREDLTREEVHEAVDRIVEELLEKAGVEQPPVDAIELAQGPLGIAISVDREPSRRGRVQRAGGQQAIHLSPEDSEERRQWVAAQAIGDLLKPELLQRLGLAPEESKVMVGESLPNLFAQRLLVPTHFLATIAPSLDYDLLQLQERFRTTSHEVVALRLLDLPEPCIIAIVDNDHVSRRRSNAWRVNKELSPAEQKCQRAVSRTRRPKVVRADGWTVQGWPVPRVDGTREILRSVMEESGQ